MTTIKQFAEDLLSELGISPSAAPNSVIALEGWAAGEGGGTSAQNPVATYNPLNTTLSEPGSSTINSAGVRAYPSLSVGLQATAATLTEARYRQIVADLATNAVPSATWSAVQSSPWGTHDLSQMSTQQAQRYGKTVLSGTNASTPATTTGFDIWHYLLPITNLPGIGGPPQQIGEDILHGIEDLLAPLIHPVVLGLAAAVLIIVGLIVLAPGKKEIVTTAEGA